MALWEEVLLCFVEISCLTQVGDGSKRERTAHASNWETRTAKKEPSLFHFCCAFSTAWRVIYAKTQTTKMEKESKKKQQFERCARRRWTVICFENCVGNDVKKKKRVNFRWRIFPNDFGSSERESKRQEKRWNDFFERQIDEWNNRPRWASRIFFVKMRRKNIWSRRMSSASNRSNAFARRLFLISKKQNKKPSKLIAWNFFDTNRIASTNFAHRFSLLPSFSVMSHKLLKLQHLWLVVIARSLQRLQWMSSTSFAVDAVEDVYIGLGASTDVFSRSIDTFTLWRHSDAFYFVFSCVSWSMVSSKRRRLWRRLRQTNRH